MSRKSRIEQQRAEQKHSAPVFRRNPVVIFTGVVIGIVIIAGITMYASTGSAPVKSHKDSHVTNRMNGSASGAAKSAVQDVTVPALGALAARGAQAFDTACAGCHGVNASGTEQGPPLIHRIYEPSHHGDAAFYRAARMGVQPHHWPFGAMPKIDVGDQDLKAIVAYVRELQRANGIF